MARTLDRETLQDLTVNLVPVVIMGLFATLFVVYSPWGRLGLATVLQFGLVLAMVVVLLYVSAKAGAAVSRSEQEEGER